MAKNSASDKKGARYWASRALERVERDLAFSERVVSSMLKAENIPERALFTDLVYGTLRNVYYIDYVLSQFLKQALRKHPPVVKAALRVAVYQLLFSDKNAEYAVVNEAVETVKQHSKHHKSLVNAVLRNILRNEIPDPLNDKKLKKSERIAIRYSFPVWSAKALIKRYNKKQAISIMQAYAKPAQVHARVNKTKISRDEMQRQFEENGIHSAPPFELASDCLALDRPAKPMNEIIGWQEGHWSIQDAAAQLVAELLPVKELRSFIELCAAPGGKSLHIAERTVSQKEFIQVAVDISERKIANIKRQCERLGLKPISAVVTNAIDSKATQKALSQQKLPNEYDAVLLDAPCSGLGTLRRRPEIRWRVYREDISTFAERQALFLKTAAKLVRAGGILIYSVCTFTEEEGPAQIEAFLQDNPEFELYPEERFDGHADLKLASGQYLTTTVPSIDGFFYARLRKVDQIPC